MSGLIRFLIGVVPILVIVVVGAAGMGVMNALKPTPEEAEEAPRGLAIFTEPVQAGDITLNVVTQGEVVPLREVALSSQISGRVSYVAANFLEGGFVKRGDLIIRIEDADYRLGVVRAQSGVASAEQRLAREQAEADLARQDLEDLGISSPTSLALREPQLAEAQASLESAKAQLRDAELALSRTEIRAPFDGRIRSKSVDIGQFVSPGQSLGQIFSTDVAQVALPLTDTELGRLGLSLAFSATGGEKGPRVVFTADVAGKPRQWVGHVARTSAAVDSQTRLISAIAEVDDPFGAGADGDAPLAPGLFVTATIEGQTIEDVLIAPRQALRQQNKLYLADPETSTLIIREVDVLFTNTEGVYMTAGASVGELAVTSPIQAAFSGMNITIAGMEDDMTASTDNVETQGSEG